MIVDKRVKVSYGSGSLEPAQQVNFRRTRRKTKRSRSYACKGCLSTSKQWSKLMIVVDGHYGDSGGISPSCLFPVQVAHSDGRHWTQELKAKVTAKGREVTLAGPDAGACVALDQQIRFVDACSSHKLNFQRLFRPKTLTAKHLIKAANTPVGFLEPSYHSTRGRANLCRQHHSLEIHCSHVRRTIRCVVQPIPVVEAMRWCVDRLYLTLYKVPNPSHSRNLVGRSLPQESLGPASRRENVRRRQD